MENDGSDGESNAKRLKPNEEEEGNNQDQMAVANAANEAHGENIDVNDDDRPPSIFKLDIDCCEEVFAYLRLRDLHSLGQTCKKMHQFTGYFVRENYKSSEFQYDNGNIFFYTFQMNGFIEFISNLLVSSNRLERFAEFAPKFKSVRKVRLELLYDDQIDCIKEILYKCEEIDILFSRDVLNIDLYEKILKFCTNMKHFELHPYDEYYYASLENNNWLLHEYPNLESLDLYSTSSRVSSSDEIKTFFTLNKGIRKFKTNFLCLWNCRHWILDLDIDMKLDELLIGCGGPNPLLYTFNREHINLLKALYERGFYERLSLLKLLGNDSSILAEIRAPLTMEISKIDSPLPSLDLKEIKVLGLSTDTGNPEIVLANNVSTVERVHFVRLKMESILFLVRKFIELREIKIDRLEDVNSFDLVTLNEERKELSGAKSVTIYLHKSDYNAIIKMTDCQLVKIKRRITRE